jgi:serine O-acetyltransferase
MLLHLSTFQFENVANKKPTFKYTSMRQQMSFFLVDLRRMLGKQKSRILYIWLSRVFWGIFSYRLDRGLFLLLGKSYKYIRIILIPFFNLWNAYSNIDINYKAVIGKGLIVLHPSMGIVISGKSLIGDGLTLTGGNVIGAKAGCDYGDLIIGNNCSLGANAVIIGPIKLANNITIGALACVLNDCETNDVLLVGIPAKPRENK